MNSLCSPDMCTAGMGQRDRCSRDRGDNSICGATTPTQSPEEIRVFIIVHSQELPSGENDGYFYSIVNTFNDSINFENKIILRILPRPWVGESAE